MYQQPRSQSIDIASTESATMLGGVVQVNPSEEVRCYPDSMHFVISSKPRHVSIVLFVIALLVLAAACAKDAPTPTPNVSSAPFTSTPVATVAQPPGEIPTLPSSATAVQPTTMPQTTPATTPISVGGNALASIEVSNEPPERDLFELALRLRPSSGGPVSRVVNPQPVSYEKGHSETFWVSDLVDNTSYTIEAAIKVVSEHAYWYVDNSIDLSIDDLRKAAKVFEEEIHPKITDSIGDIWNPGVDNDPRLTILHTALEGVAGYYGSQDEYPRETHPQSNEREMIYMDGSRLKPGSRAYLGVLAHEFQHAVHWNIDSGEEAWINEGLSEVATELAGFRASFVDLFLQNPDTQLNYWPDEIGTSGPHYGAATLFLSYLAQHYGGYDRLEELARRQEDGVNGIGAYLSDYDVSFEDVFKDWVVANYLDASEGRFSYPDRSIRVRDVDLMSDYGEKEDTLPQFATRYVDLRLSDGDAVVSFEGDSIATQVGAGCHSGRYCWWGNRGDSIDSKLTREFDLSGLNSATLEFWMWFSIEKDWDYAYVEASADGGDTWAILKGRHTTSENPIGNSFGDALTGNSDGWVQESIDLTSYAGGKVLVRFEYVTDDTVYLDGFVIDDMAVPELGFFDDAEQDNGWQPEGFKRIDNVLSQDYFVQVIEVTTDGEPLVRDVELDADRRGELLVEGFGSRIERAVIVISPITRDTHHPARYSLSISAPK